MYSFISKELVFKVLLFKYNKNRVVLLKSRHVCVLHFDAERACSAPITFL